MNFQWRRNAVDNERYLTVGLASVLAKSCEVTSSERYNQSDNRKYPQKYGVHTSCPSGGYLCRCRGSLGRIRGSDGRSFRSRCFYYCRCFLFVRCLSSGLRGGNSLWFGLRYNRVRTRLSTALLVGIVRVE